MNSAPTPPTRPAPFPVAEAKGPRPTRNAASHPRPRATVSTTIRLSCLCLLLAACSSLTARPPMPLGQDSFPAYQDDARVWLAAERSYQIRDPGTEIALNMPREWRPAGLPPGGKAPRGILLLHGLGDSPFSFSDIGPALAEQGFLVRALLLPGHGTDPLDLDRVDSGDWRRLAEDQYAALRRDADMVYAGGFSTGANLALLLAAAHEDIAGLLLFSPAFRTRWNNTWLAGWIGPFMTWWRQPSPDRPQQTPVRYMNIPVNGFALFHQTRAAAEAVLDGKPYEKPALLVVSRHDSVLDTAFIAERFSAFFTHPDSRLIWYGDAPGEKPGGGPDGAPEFFRESRILQRPDRLPQEHISRFSHMAALFSPDNALYGRDGTLRICENGQTPEAYALCREGRTELWFSDWGYTEQDKVHARLTFNPYFAWQADVMRRVLEAAICEKNASGRGK